LIEGRRGLAIEGKAPPGASPHRVESVAWGPRPVRSPRRQGGTPPVGCFPFDRPSVAPPDGVALGASSARLDCLRFVQAQAIANCKHSFCFRITIDKL
jgi:hypothetical protein